MKQRFLSFFIAVTLMASVIAGAMGVSLRYAKADDPSSYGVGYFGDLASEARESCPAIRLVYFDTLCAYVSENFDSSLVVVMHDLNTVNWYFAVYTFNSNTAADRWAFTDRNYSVFRARSSSNNFYFYCQYAIGWNSNNSFSVSNVPQYIESANGSSVTYGTQGYFVPSPTNTGVSGRVCYANQTILAWSGTGSVFNEYWVPNLLNGNAPPEYDEINLVTFHVGIKRFLTVDDQDFVQGMDPEKEGYTWAILGLDSDGNDYDRILTDSDLVVVPNADFYTDDLFNLATYGALCWELPDDLDVIASSGFGVRNILGQIDHLVAVCVNCPYWVNEELPTEDLLQDEQYMQAFDTFNTYVTSYNTTHVVPETLAETLFGVEGGKLYPVTVSEPGAVAATRNDSGAYSVQLHNFQWSMTEPSNLGYNYELFDVVIIPSNYAGYYGLVYFYDDTLNPPYQFVDRVSFDSLLNSFDCIIIVPDDAGTLEDNTWWQQLVPASMRGDMAVSGTSSLGIEYVDIVSGNEFQGFMIITKKAIQKQQLFVFNDGITKTYKLMSDYIEKRGDWEDSFLTWTASLFAQWQTLDGKLGDIYNLLFNWQSLLENISNKLDQIAENTSEEDPGYWFISFYNWVKRWEPSNLDFANWVDSWDDFTDDLPDPGSGVTVIPLPTSIPTAAVAGG